MNTFIYPEQQKLREEYEKLYPEYQEALKNLGERIDVLLQENAVRSSVKMRVKSFDSYYRKLLERMQSEEQKPSLPKIHDLMGIRIVCPFLENLVQAEDLLKKNFVLHEIDRKGENHSFKEFGYQSIHLLIELPKDLSSRFPKKNKVVCEVQIRSILQDAWAEVEHELVYKANFTPFDEPMKRKLAALNANLSLSDIIFQEIRDYQRQLHSELEKRRVSFMKQVELQDPVHSADDFEENRTMQREFVNPVLAESVDQLILDALLAHNKKDFSTAIRLYNAIFEHKIKRDIRAVILVHRGMAFFAESRYSESLADFSAASALNPENHKVYYYQGIVYRLLGETGKALQCFEKSLKIKPYNSDCLLGIAHIHAQTGDYPAALDYCEKALRIDPNFRSAQEFKKHVAKQLDF